MAYPRRQTPAGLVFHVLNRGVQRRQLFETDRDYEAFMRCLAFVHARVSVSLFAFCVMPNHFHFVLTSKEDGQISRFMRLLQGTHGKRWHACRDTSGTGAVYQGRFKAFPVQSDRHFYTVCRYVERNALRAGLVKRAEDWPWGSLAQGLRSLHSVPLSDWPIVRPDEWVQWVNGGEPIQTLASVRKAVATGHPFGESGWATRIAKNLGIEQRLNPPGRPWTDL
jgi:putative transposase